jgi:hypothetical protein
MFPAQFELTALLSLLTFAMRLFHAHSYWFLVMAGVARALGLSPAYAAKVGRLRDST